jgi:uncharacterized membrane protein
MLSFILVLAVLSALGTLSYAILVPGAEEKFTEFYILGPGGAAQDYPEEAVVGEEVSVMVGIINREQETKSYRLEVEMGGTVMEGIGPIILGHEGKWQQEVGFAPIRVGEQQKVQFVLYQDGEAHHQLHLWIDVLGQ